MWHYRVTQSQRCDHDNDHIDDNVMCASAWFEFFGGLFRSRNPCCMGGKLDKKGVKYGLGNVPTCELEVTTKIWLIIIEVGS